MLILLQELTETSKKLAEETSDKGEEPSSNADENVIKTDDKDV